jgi:hypothetical protein
MRDYNLEYLQKCKELYKKNIIPCESVEKKDQYLTDINTISNNIISIKGLKYFSSFLLEGHYLVDLWTAHLLFLMDINDEIKNECLKKIIDYSDNPLVPEVSKMELDWLNKNSFI